MNDNKFFNQQKNYYLALYSHIWNQLEIISTLKINLNEYSTDKSNSSALFSKNTQDSFTIKPMNNDELSTFNTFLEEIDPFSIRDRADVYYYIKAFGKLLYWAEDILFYPNDDTKLAYSKIEKNTNSSTVYFNFDNFDELFVSIEFQESAINLPNKKLKDNPLNFMDDEETMATFIKININRNFGNNRNNEITSILGSNEFNLSDDETFMLDLVEDLIFDSMNKSLKDIENHILFNCCNIKNGLKVEDFKNGITLWGPATTK